jgi:hypothetical protein
MTGLAVVEVQFSLVAYQPPFYIFLDCVEGQRPPVSAYHNNPATWASNASHHCLDLFWVGRVPDQPLTPAGIKASTQKAGLPHLPGGSLHGR